LRGEKNEAPLRAAVETFKEKTPCQHAPEAGDAVLHATALFSPSLSGKRCGRSEWGV